MDEPLQFTRIDAELVKRAAAVIDCAGERGLTIVSAESCTGGVLASVLSEAPGAGEQFHGGFVVYTKKQKTVALGIPADLLARETAVSRTIAYAMAQAALERSAADIAVAITGVAGPACDEDSNPVGLVHLAAARRGGEVRHVVRNFGDIGRGHVRYKAVREALELIEAIALAEPAAAAASLPA